LWAIHGILDITRGLPINAWPRHLGFVLAGLTDQPASTDQPPLSSRKMTQIIRSSPSAQRGEARHAEGQGQSR